MGGCVSRTTVYNIESVNRRSNERRFSQNANNPNNSQTINNNIINEENKFKDLEEYEEEFSGEGIKKIKAYKFIQNIDALQKLRMEFWMSRKQNIRHWQTIQRACETDTSTAELILANAGFVCLEGNMKCIVDTNSTLVFNIPNFCINDPLYKKEFNQVKDVPDKTLIITLIYVFKNMTKYNVKISNKKTGADLKNIFYEKEKILNNEYRVRLLYKGAEIIDKDTLSIYNFDNFPQVQVSCVKIENDFI